MVVIGIIYLLYFATEDKPNLAMLDNNTRLQSAIHHLNNTGVDPLGQAFKYHQEEGQT